MTKSRHTFIADEASIMDELLSHRERVIGERVDAIMKRRVHRIHRMQASGLLTESQADSLLDELDVPGSAAWQAHQRFRDFVTHELRTHGSMA